MQSNTLQKEKANGKTKRKHLHLYPRSAASHYVNIPPKKEKEKTNILKETNFAATRIKRTGVRDVLLHTRLPGTEGRTRCVFPVQ